MHRYQIERPAPTSGTIRLACLERTAPTASTDAPIAILCHGFTDHMCTPPLENLASAPLANTEAAFSRPLGQTTLRWTNPGQEAVLRVTKALSVATTFAETIPGRLEDYPTVNWDTLGTRFRRIEVETVLTAVNHRDAPVTLVIRPTVVGEYQSASIPPDSVQTEGSREARSGNGNRQPNPTQKLRWSLSLPPGESLALTYRYTTLIRI